MDHETKRSKQEGTTQVYPDLEHDSSRLLKLMETVEEYPAMRHKLIEWMRLMYPSEMSEE